jgi:membrane-bound metal-dependent hydrolase YbcI (DUF457 family)
MLLFSHFVITTVVLLLAQKLGAHLSPWIIFLCYLLGVFIDLDHLIVHPKKSWLAAKGFLSGAPKAERGKHYLHSYLQEPWFGVVILIIAFFIFWRAQSGIVFLPVAALWLHILADGLMKFDNLLLWPFSHRKFKGFLPSNSRFEYIASSALSAVVLYMVFAR